MSTRALLLYYDHEPGQDELTTSAAGAIHIGSDGYPMSGGVRTHKRTNTGLVRLDTPELWTGGVITDLQQARDAAEQAFATCVPDVRYLVCALVAARISYLRTVDMDAMSWAPLDAHPSVSFDHEYVYQLWNGPLAVPRVRVLSGPQNMPRDITYTTSLGSCVEHECGAITELYAAHRSAFSAEYAIGLGFKDPAEKDLRGFAKQAGLRIRKLRENAKGYLYHVTSTGPRAASMWARNEREAWDLIDGRTAWEQAA